MAANFEFRLEAEPGAEIDTETMERHSAGLSISDSNEKNENSNNPSISKLMRYSSLSCSFQRFMLMNVCMRFNTIIRF